MILKNSKVNGDVCKQCAWGRFLIKLICVFTRTRNQNEAGRCGEPSNVNPEALVERCSFAPSKIDYRVR